MLCTTSTVRFIIVRSACVHSLILGIKLCGVHQEFSVFAIRLFHISQQAVMNNTHIGLIVKQHLTAPASAFLRCRTHLVSVKCACMPCYMAVTVLFYFTFIRIILMLSCRTIACIVFHITTCIAFNGHVLVIVFFPLTVAIFLLIFLDAMIYSFLIVKVAVSLRVLLSLLMYPFYCRLFAAYRS